MYSSKRYSEIRVASLSAMSHESYLKDIADRASYALQPLTNPKAILVTRHEMEGFYWCYIREVKLDLPNEGYLIAISLDVKP